MQASSRSAVSKYGGQRSIDALATHELSTLGELPAGTPLFTEPLEART